jgi:hypothetical protein
VAVGEAKDVAVGEARRAAQSVKARRAAQSVKARRVAVS